MACGGLSSHHHPRGVGSAEASRNLMRSRVTQRFPTKRSTRSPRMLWTSSLHARFVHATEILGGNESMPPLAPSFASSCSL
ncbi:hypothetical protein BHM03_00037095 [Ensete ventricosum]|nr:hypothetical protein BHM03_00037095 [Ensete ventricosum]